MMTRLGVWLSQAVAWFRKTAARGSATTRQNSAFLKAATEAIPDLERFHTAIDAAEAKREAQ